MSGAPADDAERDRARIGRAVRGATPLTARATAPRDRVIRGDGTPESAWQGWPLLAAAPEIALDSWLPATRRLVVVAPHPDDEVLACGGLLHLHLARGGRATVVALTDGEASHAGCADWPPERLAPVRRAESAAGLARLADGQATRGNGGIGGIGADTVRSDGSAGVAAAIDVVRLGLPDGCVARHVDALQDRLGTLLDPADLVVATWRLDGHPDHDAAGSAAAHACSEIGCELAEALVWMWHWSAPGDPGVPWQRLRRLPLPSAARAAKRRALAEHATQVRPRSDGVGPVVVPSLVARCERTMEFYLA